MQEVTFGLRSTGFSGLGGFAMLLKEGDMLGLILCAVFCVAGKNTKRTARA